MRERISRGKRLDNGEWVFGYFWSNDVGNNFIRVTEENDEIVLKDYEVVPETVGDYTGLTDKNGRKIFEGDIIAFRSSESIYEVAYDITDSKFIILLRNGKDSFLRFYNISAYYFSVIGNKWDNSELLEVEK